MIRSLACTDPQFGDSVTKGKLTRTVTHRNGGDVSYVTQTGKAKSCWITTWQDWCKNADLAVMNGQSKAIDLQSQAGAQ